MHVDALAAIAAALMARVAINVAQRDYGPDLEPPVGIEPTTCSLRVNRSAD